MIDRRSTTQQRVVDRRSQRAGARLARPSAIAADASSVGVDACRFLRRHRSVAPCNRAVSPVIEELLLRVAPGYKPAGEASFSICCAGLELPVVLNGATETMLLVSQAGPTPFAFAMRSLLVLRIVTGAGALRVDLPVEVATCGRTSMVLRVLSSPVVLRRRVVRDLALEEALTVPKQPLVA